MYVIYLGLIIASVLVLWGLVRIQLSFSVSPKIETALTPRSEVHVIQPQRGKILDRSGHVMAMDCPAYKIGMDCTVRKEEFARIKDTHKRDSLEKDWRSKARALSAELAKELPGKSESEFLRMILKAREADKKYLKIASSVDWNAYNRIKEFPLFNEGRFKGGFIAEHLSRRIYPYGKMARRTIGFVRSNESGVSNTHIGIEGRFNHELHGTEGREYLKYTDSGKLADNDSTGSRAVNGRDVRTTIDIDFQQLAHDALYREVSIQDDLESACLVLMETSTGAIRAMVNLNRDRESGKFEEIRNIAIGHSFEPGSVFKTVTLMQVLEDGYVKSLEETIPTNHGFVMKGVPVDQHIRDYERDKKTDRISILDGFKMSSNYVFGTLAHSHYGSRPDKFVENIHSYKLGDAFDFDIDGLAAPFIPRPSDNKKGEKWYWSPVDLAAMGYGYATRETPLHILCFYNAIANKGKMMRPYLVEDIESDGKIFRKYGPATMSTICRKEVADTITRALKAVTEEGTAKRLKGCNPPVAGKTGTSFAAVDGKYMSTGANRIYQGTFVGFFPADEPRYSVICSIFSKPTGKMFQGGGIPASAVRTLAEGLRNIDPAFRETLEAAVTE